MQYKANIPYTFNFMMGALEQRNRVKESLQYSCIDQIDLHIDLDLLLKQSNLTKRQQEVIELYYCEQMTQDLVSKKLGISQQAVLSHLKQAKHKIQHTLDIWREKDETC